MWQTEGVNDRVQLARINLEMNRRIRDAWMMAGVTMVDPSSTWIDVDVDLARDVVLMPGVILQGATTVGEGAIIGPDTTLMDVEVGPGAEVIRTHGSFAVIGENATVGPFAYLRPGTELGKGGKIGTFVETKNAVIGDGAKVPHLTYVGDAVIDEGVNIGAGTIFANYDGIHKSTTHVGKNAFVGSNSVLVAPVDIGAGALVGAGSTITDDVPAGSLALARGRQRNIDGWTADRRPDRRRPPRRPSTTAASTLLFWSPERRRRPDRRVADRQEHKHLMLFSGRACPELAQEVATLMDEPIVPTRALTYANSEIYVRFEESVRGCDAFVIQSHTAPVNEGLMEQLIMVDALKRASAKRITVVAPFYPYARQDKKHLGREPISARLVADLYKTAGADRLMSVDLHAAQIQGFFDGPVDHLWGLPVLSDYVKKNYDVGNMCVVSPDAGRVRLADMWTDVLGTPLAIVHKRRDHDKANTVAVHEVVGDVEGKVMPRWSTT